MLVGDVIRKYRKQAGITQEEMARRLGVTTPAVNKWENNNTQPDISLLAPIARLLGITTDTLLSFKDSLSTEEIAAFVKKLDQDLETRGYAEVFAEVKKTLQFNRSRKDGIRVVDLYHALHEEFGLYEAEKSILSIMDKSITLTEHEKKRAMLEERTSMTTGDVEYNPKDLWCPNCGCKYIVFYEYRCFLRKSDSDCTPAKGQRLSALSIEFGEEYNYCLGCGNRFNDHDNCMEEEQG